MSKSKHSDAQIIAALKQVEADDVARSAAFPSTRSTPGLAPRRREGIAQHDCG
jgi:hypothetical protein